MQMNASVEKGNLESFRLEITETIAIMSITRSIGTHDENSGIVDTSRSTTIR